MIPNITIKVDKFIHNKFLLGDRITRNRIGSKTYEHKAMIVYGINNLPSP